MAKGKPRGPNRTMKARAKIYEGHLAGKTCDQITADLAAMGQRALPQGSWDMFEQLYKPVLIRHPELFDKWVKHPPSREDIPKD